MALPGLRAGHMHALVDSNEAAFAERLRDVEETANALLPVAEELHAGTAESGGRAAVERVLRLVMDARAHAGS